MCLLRQRPAGRRPAALNMTKVASDQQPIASVSLDLDNVWSYMKTHGDPGWSAFPSYLGEFNRVGLKCLTDEQLRITFFVVGQDAALERNAEALAAIAAAGHEIGNHSFHHEPWLHLRSHAQLAEEIEQAEETIEAATGRRPRGFRGPGFSLSANTLAVLAEVGSGCDATTMPTFIGPLARAYYFSQSKGLTDAEKHQRSQLFGSFGEGFRPLKSYEWNAGGRGLIEIPVTTMPLVRVPFHQSYLLYLAGVSRSLALRYLSAGLALCRLTRTEPSFLLHPLDFLGGDRVKQLAFFPGMGLPTAFKVDFFHDVMAILTRHFRLVTMEEHAGLARRALSAGGQPVRRVYAS